MNELTKRILFAIPAAALFLYVTWVGGWFFTSVVIAITLLIQYEVFHISSEAGFRPDPFFPYTIALWVMLIPRLEWPFEIGLLIFLLFVSLQVFRQSETHMQEFISTLFCGLYAPLGLVTILLIRNSGGHESGFMLTVGLLLMVWANDIFAYFGGKYLGSRKLAPKVSPQKTWEGFIFGIGGSFAGLFLAMWAVPLSFPLTLVQALPLALLVSLFGPLGDLAESKLKRAAGVKDASHILPGHGGFFDRFDALILAAPAFYIYIRLLDIAGYVTL